jgi:anti-sigma B factor antagonist
MSLTIKIDSAPAPYEHVTIMRPEGRATLGDGAGALRDAIRDQKPGTKLLLDMTGVLYTDSSGIAELVSGFITITNGGGELKLLAVQKPVKDLLQITKFYSEFDVYNDKEAALRSFYPPRPQPPQERPGSHLLHE